MERVGEILGFARRHFRWIRVNYVVGLDTVSELLNGFAGLSARGLIDDVVPNVFVTYTIEMPQFRVAEGDGVHYLDACRRALKFLGLHPRRVGLTKDIFPHFNRMAQYDGLATAVAGRDVPG